jgi:hypothetical protein
MNWEPYLAIPGAIVTLLAAWTLWKDRPLKVLNAMAALQQPQHKGPEPLDYLNRALYIRAYRRAFFPDHQGRVLTAGSLLSLAGLVAILVVFAYGSALSRDAMVVISLYGVAFFSLGLLYVLRVPRMDNQSYTRTVKWLRQRETNLLKRHLRKGPSVVEKKR